ncbi:MAG: UDP-glucose 4-epimerase GalE [Spirochaetales bacterium]|nr:UDP-glucose 4-epimerase GalE [Spirochaetales bacterium]
MKILVSGGAGYIGSTICSLLLDTGHEPVILDSLVRGPAGFVRGRTFYKGDIADGPLVKKIFTEHPDIYAAIHCAALIVVPESVEKPFEYYQENVCKSLQFYRHLLDNKCTRLVFSSSASIYDNVPGFMVTEESPLRPGSPYARTKYMMEMVLEDICRATDLRALALRYFNPIGADPKLRSGIHDKKPTHLLGMLVGVALGIEPFFKITGTDWDTRDGTGIRDYIHIWDLARAHILAIENFDSALKNNNNYNVINLGTGTGITVREFVHAFERVLGREVNKEEFPPRPGDVAGAFADNKRAKDLLGWNIELNIEQGIRDALAWGEKREEILGYK